MQSADSESRSAVQASARVVYNINVIRTFEMLGGKSRTPGKHGKYWKYWKSGKSRYPGTAVKLTTKEPKLPTLVFN